jgi:8-oxo-dGTP diphosphatase
VPVARASYPVDAEPRTVAGLLRDADYAAAALARVGHRLDADRRLCVPGTRVRIDIRLGPGIRVPVVTTVRAADPCGFTSGRSLLVRHDVRLTPAGAATRVDDEIRWTVPCGRRTVAALLDARAAELRARVAAAREATVVVATALLRDGRLLAARRTRPPALAGRWELPGGRVEPGETECDAVTRECREELGAEVVATGRIGTDLPIAAGLLRVHCARLVPGSPEPTELEHSAVRWVGAAELDGLDWVDADRAVLADLRHALGAAKQAT